MSPTGRPEGESLARSDKVSQASPVGRRGGASLARSGKVVQ
jgi:hypothetical protein